MHASNIDLPSSLKNNPWLKQWVQLHDDGSVSIFTGKVELGQGIVHALKMLACEELCVPPHAVTMVTTGTHQSPDEGMTSGSLSIQDSGRAIRHACAHVRALLLQACAKRHGLDVSLLLAREGAIYADAVQIASYAELASEIDVQQPVDCTMPLLPQVQWQFVGRDVPREDLAALVQAKAIFIHDLQLSGMLHGRMVRAEGVNASLDEGTWQQAQGWMDQHPDVLQRVRDGQLVGVIANTERAAIVCAEHLQKKLRWQVQPLHMNLSTLAADLQQQRVETHVFHEDGVPEGDDSGQTFTATYFRPYLHHASIGTSCALAQWSEDAAHPRLRVWSHSQGVFALRKDLALSFGCDPQDIQVQHMRGAGCYGHNGADDVAFDAAWLAQHCQGRPLRLVWSRRDEMIASPMAPAMTVKVSARLDAQGQLRDWQQEIWSQGHSSRPGRAATPALLGSWHTAKPFPALEPINVAAAAGAGAERNSEPPYRATHTQVIAHRVLGLPMRTSAMRALGAHANVFAAEGLMDEMAHARQVDPVAFRAQWLDDPRAREVLQTAAQLSQWSTQRALLSKQEGRGMGVAYARYKSKGAFCAVVAQVHVTDVVRVERLWVVADIGNVIQPDGAKLQLEGGAIQSTSWALKEEARFDDTRITTTDWEQYPILRFSEVPDVQVHVMQRPEHDSLGAGEAAQGPTTAAIANAVFHALGVRVRQLPMTPEALMRAIHA